MDQAAPASSLPRLTRPGRDLILVVLAAIVIVAIGAVAVGRLAGVGSSGAAVPVSPAVEARWGIRVTQVAPTADSGLVDVRFTVLDPDKALDMMSDVANLPILRTEDTGTVVSSAAAMAPGHDLIAGRTYFVLYRNAEGAVRPGTSVTITFGDLSIEHVVAR